MSTTNQGIKLFLLGGFDVRLNGQTVNAFAYNKLRALLAYLAVNQEHEIKREVLAELLWGENDNATARANLRRALSNLRRLLETPSGPPLFLADKQSIRFQPDIYVDSVVFLKLISSENDEAGLAAHNRALSLYQGEFMAGFTLPDCPRFEAWLQIQREALCRSVFSLLEKLSTSYMRLGDYKSALTFALRYIELESWNEEAHRRVMRLYALNAQHSLAVRQYELCSHILQAELGVLPSVETQQLFAAISGGKFERRSCPDIPLPQAVSTKASERRQATVLYCDLHVDVQNDADEVLVLLQMSHKRCVEVVRKYSGYVVQSHGGGFFAYFGCSEAIENAACLAVEAALIIIQDAVEPVELRIGVHTGIVISGGDAFMPDKLGIVSNLAVQLSLIVSTNEVVMSHDTHQIAGGYFNCISLGVQSSLRALQSTEIFKVIQRNEVSSRIDMATR
ncbi:MAG: BTAD domain-containing putative transcriptional regulator [Gallionella sp.]